MSQSARRRWGTNDYNHSGDRITIVDYRANTLYLCGSDNRDAETKTSYSIELLGLVRDTMITLKNIIKDLLIEMKHLPVADHILFPLRIT